MGRLRTWLEGGKFFGEKQARFRSGRGTRDHVFVLNSLVNNRLKRKGRKLYTAFVNFKAAFDTVDWNLLIDKLRKAGIRGKMLTMIERIYEETWNEVIFGEQIADHYRTNRGVSDKFFMVADYESYVIQFPKFGIADSI